MLKDRSGNVAIIFALSLIPLLLAAGMAIDIGNILSSRSQIQDAADSAILAALAESTPSNKRTQVAQAAFLSALPANLRDLAPTFNVMIEENGPERSASATYSVNIPLAFAGILGLDTMAVTGETGSGLQIGGSMDIHLWLDSSASMGVAATETDRDNLKALTGCFFACHMDGPPSSQQKAHTHGITLRLDLMRQNVLSLMASIREVQIEGQVVRYSLAGLAAGFETRKAMTENYDDIRAAVQNFALSGTSHGQAASRITPALATGVGTMPLENGDGTPDRPRQFVVLVTDGMQFNWNSISPGPISNTSCEVIKGRGIPVAVIQLRYVPDPGNVHYEYWVAPHINNLGPALQACASPGMFYSADSPTEIQQAFAELAIRIRGALRLTH